MDTDYHFVRGKLSATPPSKVKKQRSTLGSLKVFFPVFLLSAILPLFLFAFMKPGVTRTITQADESEALRVWIEPASVVARSGEDVALTVFAEYDNGEALEGPIEVSVPDPWNIIFEGNHISYQNPLAGKAILGTIIVNAITVGTYTIDLPENAVTVPNATSSLRIVTSPSTFIIK